MAIQFIVKLLNSIFNTKCLYKGSGEMKRGPGFICGFYIILMLSGLVMNIAFPQENIDKKTRIKNIITDVVHALFSILFMYHMCYICRGFVGFLLLLLVNITYAVIRYGLF
jgi:hypothetical protein